MKKRLAADFNTRQYMNCADFELFYYSDTELGSVAAHEHDYYEFYFFLEGDVQYHIGGSLYLLKYGDCLLIPPQTPHYPVFLSHDRPYRRFVFWLGRDYCRALQEHDPELTYAFDHARLRGDYRLHCSYPTAQAVQGKLLDLLEELGGSQPFRRQCSQLMALSFLVYINRLFFDSLHQAPASYESALYLNVCDYIGRHLEEDLSLDTLASFFYVSKYHIAHIFKENMGISLHQYILKKRLHASKNAVLSDQPISHIYQQYGFRDYTSFFRAFKKEYGVSPREYREQHRLADATEETL